MENKPMTKEQVLQKIKEILAKDKRFIGATIQIDFVVKDKLKPTNNKYKQHKK